MLSCGGPSPYYILETFPQVMGGGERIPDMVSWYYSDFEFHNTGSSVLVKGAGPYLSLRPFSLILLWPREYTYIYRLSHCSSAFHYLNLFCFSAGWGREGCLPPKQEELEWFSQAGLTALLLRKIKVRVKLKILYASHLLIIPTEATPLILLLDSTFVLGIFHRGETWGAVQD